MANVQTGFVEINGANFYYEISGEGHPFVMLHAGIADSRMWDDQFNFFAQHYKVIRFDQRGYGKTEPAAGEFQRYEDLYALLKHLGIERAYLMGCSMGGGVCMNFALQHPEMSAALIMVCSGPPGFKFETPSPKQWDEAVAAFDNNELEKVSELEVQIWFDGKSRTPEQVDPAVRKKVFDMNLIALQYEKRELGKELPLQPPAAERLAELKLPTLVIVGDLDTDYIQAAADHMAAQIAGARKVVISPAAHLPNMEHPTVFNQHILDFLTGLG